MNPDEHAAAEVASTSFQMSPPPPFDFGKPESWIKWVRRFERYRQASGLASKPEENQVNTLIYTMGDEADDIFSSFNLTDAQKKEFKTVKEKFDNHFVAKRNVIFERAKFNQRNQEPNETVDSFITDLYNLAEHCSFGVLKEEMIRDRIVVGLKDMKLSEQLQMDSELTLEKATAKARQSEAVKKQQVILRNLQGDSASNHSVDRICQKALHHKSLSKTNQRTTQKTHPKTSAKKP